MSYDIKNQAMRKMSDIMKEMAMTLLINPDFPSSEAAHVALLFSSVAWNRAIRREIADGVYKAILKEMESSNPELWKEFISKDHNEIISGLMKYKEENFPDDKREIKVCGIREHKVHVEWVE